MDIEQLKIVAEAIGGLGNDAKWGVIAWVAFTEGVKVIIAGIIVFGIGSVVKHLVNAVKDYNANEDGNAEMVRTLANMMGVTVTYLDRDTRDKILRATGTMIVECKGLKEWKTWRDAQDASKSSLKGGA